MLLALAALLVVIGGGTDGDYLDVSSLRVLQLLSADTLPQLREAEALNGTPDSILRRFVPDIRVAGESVAVEPMAEGVTSASGFSGHIAYEQGETLSEAPSGGGLDGLIIEATEHWGVEWAASSLAYTEWCESRGRDWIVGAAGELGRYQFLPSTWATTPYASYSPTNPEAATLAAAWMVSVGRQYEFSCFPRR